MDTQKDTLVHELPIQNKSTPSSNSVAGAGEFTIKKTLTIFGLVIVVGIISGYVISYIFQSTSGGNTGGTVKTGGKVIETAGVKDTKVFKDSAEGVLREGGHEESGEGNFHLVRPGGEDQTVYMTSSTVDMTEYVGRRVKVYGETFASQSVGWLMDVGYIEVLK